MVARQGDEVRQFVISQVENHPGNIVALTAAKFNISRQAAHRYVAQFVRRGILQASGTTRDRCYKLVTLEHVDLTIPIGPSLEEDVIWAQSLRPKLAGLRENVDSICHYGFTEMFNNVIDHSQGTSAEVYLDLTAASVTMRVVDNGVGIFNKITTSLRLPDARLSLLELAKGKFTTDPRRHTGEGIFFTSRAFDAFSILAGGLSLVHRRDRDDWLIENITPHEGTEVIMQISTGAEQSLETLFGRFSGGAANDYSFSKTHVPLKLARFGSENLVSRSQAKRVLARFERFEEIFLDFEGIAVIGQAFADEIFRVFAQDHPRVIITAINTAPQVRGMIERARAAAERQPE